ncbi:PIN domain-containing protein [Cellulomonas sp. NPDC055163]
MFVPDPTLIRLLSAIAANPAKREVGKRTFRLRVARRSASLAQSAGIGVTVRGIFGWLGRPDTRTLLQTGQSSSFPAALDDLSRRISGGNRGADAERLLPIIIRETTIALELNEALADLESRLSAQIVKENEATRQTVAQAYSPASKFDQNSRQLHPWRATEAAALREAWPRIAEMVQAIAESPDPARTLGEWADSRPRILEDAGAGGFLWLGRVAADYKAGNAAAYFFNEAIEAGATPQGYVLARAAMALDGIDDARADSLLDAAQSSEPLSATLTLLRAGDDSTASATVREWNPTAPHDVALKAILLARSLIQLDEQDHAIEVLSQAAAADPYASGPAMSAAALLARRARLGETATPYHDLDVAFRLAIQARNARRSWGGDSAAAVVLAAGIIVLYGDIGVALGLVTAQPDGEATPAESADPTVSQERAVLLAMTAPPEMARAAIRSLSDPHAIALASGIVAINESNESRGAELLLDAYKLADDDMQRLRVGRLLSEHSDTLPDLSELESRFPDAVRDLRKLHAVLAPGTDRLTRLRSHQDDDPAIAVTLAEVCTAQGSLEEAATVLERAGRNFALPRLLVASANTRMKNGEPSDAIRLCEAAIAMAGNGWPGEFTARACMFEALQADGRSEDSLQQARALVGLDPTDASATWALTQTLVQLGDISGAWTALTNSGEPIDPRTPSEARLWLQLVVRSPRAASLTTRVLSVVRTWADTPEITPAFVMGLTTLLPDPLDDADVEAVRTVVADLLDRHSDSPTLQAIPVGPDDDPLREMKPVLKRRHESLAELHTRVANGELPVGMLTAETGSVSEALLRRLAGKVFGFSSLGEESRATAAAAAINGPCLIDATALATLTLLDQATVNDLRARFSELISTHAVFHDALSAQTSLAMRSTMSVGWDPATEQPRVSTISESAASALSSRADRLVELLHRTRRRTQPPLTTFAQLNDHDSAHVWLGPADLAANLGQPLWCDDIVLARVAASTGVQVFTTVDLVRHLRLVGDYSTDIADTIEAQLLHNYFVDLGFRSDVAIHAAELASWRIEGSAFALTRSQTWVEPDGVITFVETAVARAPDLAILEGWVTAAALGVASDLPDDAASSNLQILLRRLLAQPSVRLEQVPMVLSGIRAPIAQKPGIADPLEATLRDLHVALVAKHGHQVAHILLLGLLQYASDSDKAVAARVVLTAD